MREAVSLKLNGAVRVHRILPMAPAERSMMAWTTGCGAMVSETLLQAVLVFPSYVATKTRYFSFFFTSSCIAHQHLVRALRT